DAAQRLRAHLGAGRGRRRARDHAAVARRASPGSSDPGGFPRGSLSQSGVRTGAVSARRYIGPLMAALAVGFAAEPRAGFAFDGLAVDAGERLLVIAPHPDDEILGAGGLAQRVLMQDGHVTVLYVTAGDGFDAAAEQLAAAVRTTEPAARAASAPA